MPEQLGAFCDTAGFLAILLGLLLAEGIALGKAAGGSFDAADTAPAIALPGRVGTHLIDGVVDAATVAETCFSHCELSANQGC